MLISTTNARNRLDKRGQTTVFDEIASTCRRTGAFYRIKKYMAKRIKWDANHNYPSTMLKPDGLYEYFAFNLTPDEWDNVTSRLMDCLAAKGYAVTNVNNNLTIMWGDN